MSPSPFSLLLRHLSATHRRRHFHRNLLSPLKHFSVAPSSSDPSKPSSSLSARLSFVFDKIDEIEKDRSEKDDALQRIRAWRQSKRPNHDDVPAVENQKLGFGDADELRYSGGELVKEEGLGLVKREIELAHPWSEWVELMERLVQQNYFDLRRKDEDRMLEGLGGSFELSRVVEEEGFDFTRDWKTVQTAILNFGRDRFDIFRSFSRQDIQLLVGYGCPSVDKKVVFSSKLLRKHAHLDEGDVCSSCSLRSSCERAYLVTNKEDEARTLDMMRVLLTYGFDHITGSVQNKSLLKQKSVKHVVRKLLHEVVRLSAVPIDPNLPPPVIKPRPPKVKQPPPPPRKRVGRDDIEMKKGDWLCPKCNFMNFAKNVVCLQCDAKRPKRELLPGEWECPECNFLNYRRNMACFSCEHKRPPDEYTDTQVHERQHRPTTRLEKMANRAEVSKAWNFDFDDDESDGADVAAFEYADPNAMHEDSRLDNESQHTNFGRVDDDLYRASRSQENEYSRPTTPMKPGRGFDDFEDEDDDDVDSYELDNQNRNQKPEPSSVRFSDVEAYSESEGDDDLPRYNRASSRPLHKKSNLGDNDLDFDSDEDLPVHPGWKSSHVANSGRRDRPRDSRGQSKQRSHRSNQDNRLVFGSDGDDDDDLDDRRGFTPKRGRGGSKLSGQRGFSRGDDDSNRGRRQNGFRGRDDFESRESSGQRGFRQGDDGSNLNRRQNGLRGRNEFDFVKQSDFADEFGRSSSRSHRQKESFGGDRRMNGRGRGEQRGSRNGGFERKFNSSDNWTDVDGDRPRSQRVNVR